MVDKIKFNKILSPLSPARKVIRTDSRGRNNQGTPFKESLARKQKKKKTENPASAKQPESDISLRNMTPKGHADSKIADQCDHENQSVRSRIIDIRV